MPDIFEPTEGLKFSEKLVNGRYPVKVPSFMDVHDWWGNWETARFRSMEELLKPGMVLYDCGAFDGWQSTILSRFVGGAENMALIEPVYENWANIKATWEANCLPAPGMSYIGFVGPKIHSSTIWRYEWPDVDYSKAIAVTKFKHICENPETPSLPLTTLTLAWREPDAINIDVEGAELSVLRSGEEMLRKNSPLLWVSIHPEFMRERYGHDPGEISKFLISLGYRSQFLGTDHEDHWLWRKF